MRTNIIRIGKSWGIQIPKSLLKAAGLRREVEISVQSGALVIRPVQPARTGWDAAFQEMARRGDDALLDGEIGRTAWDDTEWTW